MNEDDCSEWHIRKLDQAPDWYLEALKATPSAPESRVSDSLWRTDYRLSDESTLVHFRSDLRYEPGLGDGFPGALYLYGKDTVRLDSSFGGYKAPAFTADSTRCAVWERTEINPDFSEGRIVMYELWNGSRTVVTLTIGTSKLAFSPSGWLAYRDWADLWVCDPWGYRSELIFKRGGSYAVGCGNPMWRYLSDIRWSPDGKSIVFKYIPGRGAEAKYELYEAYHSW